MADVEQMGEGAETARPIGVGDGPMPDTLMRFNWGAFCLPALWGVVHGTWSLIGLWLAAQLLPVAAAALGFVSTAQGTISMPALIGVSVIAEAFLGFVRIWSGASANRLYWERASLRLAALPAATPKVDTAQFRARQRLWEQWGAAGLGLGLVLTVVSNYMQLKPYGLQWAFVGESLVFLAAEVALGIWFAGQMRAEYPLVDATSQTDASEPDRE